MELGLRPFEGPLAGGAAPDGTAALELMLAGRCGKLIWEPSASLAMAEPGRLSGGGAEREETLEPAGAASEGLEVDG
jgi:hypothetical protein